MRVRIRSPAHRTGRPLQRRVTAPASLIAKADAGEEFDWQTSEEAFPPDTPKPTQPTTPDDFEILGAQAFAAGLGHKDNPHPKNTQAWAEWCSGFDQAEHHGATRH